MADNNTTCDGGGGGGGAAIDDPDPDPANEAPKWRCEYCTYANYQSSLFCVMCKGEKPLLDIFRLNNKNLSSVASHDRILDSEHEIHFSGAEEGDQQLQLSQNNDHQQAANSSNHNQQISANVAPPPQQQQQQQQRTTDGNKWPCAVCTYLNWPIALRCTQCLTERNQSSSPLLDASNAEEDLLTAAAEHLQRTLTIRSTSPGSGGGAAVAQGAVVRRGLCSPKSQQAMTVAATEITTTTTSSVMKWRCQECTYENFPKSQKCCMCSAARKTTTGAVQNNNTNISSSSKINPSNQSSCKNNIINNNNNNNQNPQSQSIRSTSNSPARLSPSTMGAATPIIGTDTEISNAAAVYFNASSQSPPLSLSPPNSLARKQQRMLQQENNNNNNNNINLNNNLTNNNSEERQLLRKLRKHGDWRWLHACLGVVENNYAAVEDYLSYGGAPGRALTAAEVSLLNRNSAFDVGFTLIHLAIRFQREHMLPMLLSQISGTGTGIKRVPSYVAPDLAADIRRQFSTLLRISRKGQFNCHYVQEHATFALPSEIEDLPVAVQEQLYEELLDKDAQKQLENPPPVLNWSLEITVRLGSRLVALWNRSAGDCLLDSAMQATWGIFDRDNVLRRALADSLHQCAHLFYPRWKEYEMIQASLMHFQLEEAQWQRDWSNLLALASQPGASLEQLHIFALAHIFRRPIIVYGVKFVKSFRGEDIGFARFEGVYLPLLWEPSFCTRSPLALGYTRGHFSALVPTESYSSRLEATANDEDEVTFLPLMDCDMKLLPIHFINETEMGREESLMRQWLDVCMTEGGLMVAQQRLNQRPLLVAQMIEEWLNYYRRLAQVFTAPFGRHRPQHALTGYSSDGDTEED